jgi:hypothetical protein
MGKSYFYLNFINMSPKSAEGKYYISTLILSKNEPTFKDLGVMFNSKASKENKLAHFQLKS